MCVPCSWMQNNFNSQWQIACFILKSLKLDLCSREKALNYYYCKLIVLSYAVDFFDEMYLGLGYTSQTLHIRLCRDLLNDSRRMWASWLWHWSHIILLAVTVYPLIRTVLPMTFGKDFKQKPRQVKELKEEEDTPYRFDKESWDWKLTWGEHKVCIQTHLSAVCVQWHNAEKHQFQFKDNHVDLVCQHLKPFNKNTPWPHKELRFKNKQIFAQFLICWHIRKSCILRPSQRPNPADRFIMYDWNDS